MVKLTGDDDAELVGQSIWITVKGFSVKVAKTDEGVLVDIYALGHEDKGAISSTYAFDGEEQDVVDELEQS